jgi:hypothetical protein
MNGSRIPIEGGFNMMGSGGIAFHTGAYNPAFPLIIDPSLDFATLLGGS